MRLRRACAQVEKLLAELSLENSRSSSTTILADAETSLTQPPRFADRAISQQPRGVRVHQTVCGGSGVDLIERAQSSPNPDDAERLTSQDN